MKSTRHEPYSPGQRPVLNQSGVQQRGEVESSQSGPICDAGLDFDAVEELPARQTVKPRDFRTAISKVRNDPGLQ